MHYSHQDRTRMIPFWWAFIFSMAEREGIPKRPVLILSWSKYQRKNAPSERRG
jgi:hypothetical protein